MAMASSSLMRRLSRQFLSAGNCNSPACRIVPARLSATESHHTQKVAERIVRMQAIDPEGQRHSILGLTGKTLLKALTNSRLIDPESHRLEDIYACSAECEVRIAPEWLEKLPPQSEDEIDVLKSAALRGQYDQHARLACQIIVKPELQGMVVAVPEPSPWDIP